VCIQTKHQYTSQTFPLHLVIFRKNSTNIYPCTLIILNTIVYAKSQPVCIQTKHQDTSQTFSLHLVIFRKNIYPFTNNIKYNSLCKGSACVHSDETSGHDTHTFPLHLVIFRKNSTNINACTNNFKYDSLCKGSACNVRPQKMKI
jgi:hypothetical protein